MKRVSIRLIVAFSTFVIGVLAVCFYPSSKTPPVQIALSTEGQTNLVVTKVPPDTAIHLAKLCNLINYPHAYDRKLIRLQTTYDNGIDSAGLVGVCGGERVWLTATGALEVEDKIIEAKSVHIPEHHDRTFRADRDQ